jgi:hypothetical protein
MRTHILAGLLTACTLGLVTTASAQSYVPGLVFDGPVNVVPHDDVIVRSASTSFVIGQSPPLPLYTRVLYRYPTRALVPAEVEVEPYDVAVPIVRRPYFGLRAWDR